MTWKVGIGHSACGLHVGGSLPCDGCRRAAAANVAALVGVKACPDDPGRHWKKAASKDAAASALERFAAGESLASIARATGMARETVARLVGNRRAEKRLPRFKSEHGVKGAHARMWGKSTTDARNASRTVALPRNVHV